MTDTSREAFEKWAQSFRCSFKTVQSAPYTYCNRDVQFIWESWQASRNALADEQAHLGLNEAQQVAVPTGWALVPIEPTPAILDAMSSSGWKTACYKAMLAAAQGTKLVTKKDSKTDWSAA